MSDPRLVEPDRAEPGTPYDPLRLCIFATVAYTQSRSGSNGGAGSPTVSSYRLRCEKSGALMPAP